MAILDGNMPPKSKRSDHLPRIALALHVLNYATEMLLLGQPIDNCPTVINSETLKRANTFVAHLEQQKDAVCQVSLHEKYSTFKATSVSRKTTNLIFIHVLNSLVVLTVLAIRANKTETKIPDSVILLLAARKQQTSLWHCCLFNDPYRHNSINLAKYPTYYITKQNSQISISLVYTVHNARSL